jgi:uncharacterized protein YdeI (BOF family)
MKTLLLFFFLLFFYCGSKKIDYGKEIPQNLPLTKIREILSAPSQFQDKEVLLSGKIISECGSGCWFFLQDENNDVIYVDLAPSRFAILQLIGKDVLVYGKIKKDYLVGLGVKLKQ